MAKGIAHREWTIHRSDYMDGFGNDTGFRAAVEQEAALNVHLQERLGVAIISAPVRRQGPGGTWFTEAYIYKTATVPAAQEPASEVDALEDALAEPALVDEPDRLAEVE